LFKEIRVIRKIRHNSGKIWLIEPLILINYKLKPLILTMQKYISPFRNLGLDLSQEVDKNALNLAKKRILAELDLSQKTTLIRGGIEMSKNDIVQLFDGFNKVENLDFHRQIATNRGLLAFLEKQQLDTKNEFVDDLAFASAPFKAFLSPYLTQSCAEYLTNCLKKAQSANLHIFPMPLLNQLSVNELETVWQSVETFLKDKRTQADELTARIRSRPRMKLSDADAFRAPQFVACLNWLPERFQGLRTGYVAALFHLAEACWGVKGHKVAVDILRYAVHINCASQNHKVVQARLYGYENSLDAVTKSMEQERAFKYVFGAIIAILLVFLVFKITTYTREKKPKPVVYEDRSFKFTTDMTVADTIPLNDSIPRVSEDFQKVLHNPNMIAKEKSRKSKFLIVRIDAIKKDSTNQSKASATKQFIGSFIKDFDREAAEEDPSVKKRIKN
jgi:hypothetical protein